ncbi:molecular chaperone [Vibrio cholerae]|uniref:molecular chaperone n=1 Tax=Vibrio cholerae TaxID=666 RepID=UPI00084A6D99|nr:molecular chaperone [Vibrio cholerae]EHU0373924.1 molecular chaperone [Vibrio cholerae]EJL6946437.1 molecular chaperone [Vibrio cholerae]NOF78469.1 molecular chaperone [Vibrio cholerae]NOF81660.1 molecular chaperone [Vibrio cholerae]OEC28419.1 molecular chaperone [Vibrio cholerae]
MDFSIQQHISSYSYNDLDINSPISEIYDSRIDDDLNLIDVSADNLKKSMISLRQLVVENDVLDTEQKISDSLLDAIDKSAAELEALDAWTNGGNSVIGPIIDIMYEGLISDETNESKLEDLMQLAVFDFLLNKNDWDVDIISESEKAYLGYITENFGSGMHSVYKGYDKNSPSKIVDWFLNTFCMRMINSGKIPEDSVCFKVLQIFNDEENKRSLMELARNYTNELNSIDANNIQLSNSISKSESSTHLSPTLKFFLLAQGAKEGTLSANDWVTFIQSDIEDAKAMLGIEGDSDKKIADWLADSNRNTGWVIDNSGQLDFNQGQAGGIPIEDLLSFFSGFPSRVLSDEELKQVNRIGDNVKMIMQTLKYWFQILRDERVAVARNI